MISLRASEIALRTAGVVVAVALAAVTAIWEAVLTTLYVVIDGHVVRLPAAPLAAIVANLALVWFTLKITGKVGYALIPGAAWIVVMFAAGGVTSDGDLLVQGNWVGMSTILLGALAWAGGVYLVIFRQRSREAAPVADTARRTPAGRLASTPVAPPVGRDRSRPGAKPGGGPARKKRSRR